MTAERLLIKNCKPVLPQGKPCELTDILIEEGSIARLCPGIQCPGAAEIDVGGLCAAPGLVDIHVHLRDPGQTRKEDIFSGCRAAAAGGVTSLAAMPNTTPVADSVEILESVKERSARADARVYPIAAVTVGQSGERMTDFKRLRQAGAVAFSDDGRPVMTAWMMAQAMRAASDEGTVVISHCEDPSLAGGIINEGAVAKKLGVPGIPAAAEEVQVAREIALAASFGLPVHLAHISTAGSVAMIRDAKKRGIRVTCETCPHYFSLDETALLGRDADYRMNPPLRTRADVEAIIEGLCDGTIDAIVTDHAPHTSGEKSRFETAPNGVVGLETSLAAGITYLVETGKLPLDGLIEKMSGAPAKILGMEAGKLMVGCAADLVLFDPHEKWRVEPEKFRSKGRNSAFKGMILTGKVKYTVCGGRLVFIDKH